MLRMILAHYRPTLISFTDDSGVSRAVVGLQPNFNCYDGTIRCHVRRQVRANHYEDHCTLIVQPEQLRAIAVFTGTEEEMAEFNAEHLDALMAAERAASERLQQEPAAETAETTSQPEAATQEPDDGIVAGRIAYVTASGDRHQVQILGTDGDLVSVQVLSMAHTPTMFLSRSRLRWEVLS
jgi:hypothetical protein